MTVVNGLITIAALILAGIAIYDRRRPRRTTYTSLDAAVNATTQVVSGMHEDVESLRQEIRNVIGLSGDRVIPDLIRQMHQMTVMVWALLILHALLGGSFLWLIWELRVRGVLAIGG